MTRHPHGLRKRGPYWHYRFEVRGQEFSGSTKTPSLTDAKEIAEAVHREAIRGAVGLRGAPTLAALVDEWKTAHRRTHSAKHLATADWALQALDGLAKLPATSCTTTRLTAWRTAYLADHAPATANLVLRYLSAWCRWGVTVNFLPAVPFALKPVRWQQEPRPVLRPDQVAAFLAAVDADPNTRTKAAPRHLEEDALRRAQVRAAVRFMLGLGLRESEVLGARWEWLRDGVYTVGKAKSKRTRAIPVPAWVAAALDALPRADLGLMFPGAQGRPHPQGWLRKAIARGCRAVGISVVGPHRLRATFATLHAGTGTPLADLQALMGHASITTTAGYIEGELERRRKAQEMLSEKLGFA